MSDQPMPSREALLLALQMAFEHGPPMNRKWVDDVLVKYAARGEARVPAAVTFFPKKR